MKWIQFGNMFCCSISIPYVYCKVYLKINTKSTCVQDRNYYVRSQFFLWLMRALLRSIKVKKHTLVPTLQQKKIVQILNSYRGVGRRSQIYVASTLTVHNTCKCCNLTNFVMKAWQWQVKVRKGYCPPFGDVVIQKESNIKVTYCRGVIGYSRLEIWCVVNETELCPGNSRLDLILNILYQV